MVSTLVFDNLNQLVHSCPKVNNLVEGSVCHPGVRHDCAYRKPEQPQWSHTSDTDVGSDCALKKSDHSLMHLTVSMIPSHML